MTQKTWLPTEDKYIFRCLETGKFHFVDETEWFCEYPYDTFEECNEALERYAKSL